MPKFLRVTDSTGNLVWFDSEKILYVDYDDVASTMDIYLTSEVSEKYISVAPVSQLGLAKWLNVERAVGSEKIEVAEIGDK